MNDAAKLGFSAAVMPGATAYYSRFGFRFAEEFGIMTREGRFTAALQAREFIQGALREAAGRFIGDEILMYPPKTQTSRRWKSFPARCRRNISKNSRPRSDEKK